MPAESIQLSEKEAESIQLSEEEAAELHELQSATGEPMAALLKRAALRGIKELRIEQALLSYIRTGDSTEAAAIAGLPRAVFLSLLGDYSVPMLTGPSTLAAELEYLAAAFDNPRLAAAAKSLTKTTD